MSESKFSLEDLNQRSYRDLQQLSKSLGLPSNVKKVYLIQLIHAKKYQTAQEVANIVQQVKLERQQQSQIRKFSTRKKKQLQAPEISSTLSVVSPSIISTPKRSRYTRIQYSPEISHKRLTYQPQGLLRPAIKKNKLSLNEMKNSDRVLRSCNQRLFKNLSSENSILKMVVTHSSANSKSAPRVISSVPKELKMNILCHDRAYPQVNVTKCVVTKRKARIQSSHCNVMPDSSRTELPLGLSEASRNQMPSRRPRVLSGVYPVLNNDIPNINYEYVQSIGFRRSDGTISKINALVLKNTKNIPKTDRYCRNIERTTHSIIDSKMNSPRMNISSSILRNKPRIQYSNKCLTNLIPLLNQPDISYLDTSTESLPSNRQRQIMYSDLLNEASTTRSEREITYYSNPSEPVPSSSQREALEIPSSIPYNLHQKEISQSGIQYGPHGETENLNDSVYYHKKIRNERRVSTQREYEQKLPRINEVFSKFNDLTQPIYIQVSDESERTINYPPFISRSNTNISLLENVFNFKNQFLVNQPLLQIATTTNTKCVYSASTVTTAKEQMSNVGDDCLPSSFGQASQSCTDIEMADINNLNMSDNKLNTSDPIDSLCDYDFCISPDRSSQATIPEMVEDALEFISQDGDYMERIGMDVRMQCILCSWAGPRFILEHHIRTSHSKDIIRQTENEWNISYTLGSLVQRQYWLSQVIEYESVLYILSAKYEDPEYFLTSFTTLSTDLCTKTGSMTIYNKVTGEPYTWTGEIQILPTSLPYYIDSTCHKLEISSLNLLPNSANLKLINRELVIKSPSKVIVGNPELNDIHVKIFVKILN